MPQFLSLQGAATSIIFVTANVPVVTKRLLSRQKYACHDKSFVITKLCSSQQNFCVDKHTFVVTKDVSCCDKHVFVTTKSFSWQNFCHKHTSVATKDAFCHDKNYTCGSSNQGQISDTYSKDRYWSVRLTYEGDLETQLGSYSKDRYRSVRLTSEGHPGSTCWLQKRTDTQVSDWHLKVTQTRLAGYRKGRALKCQTDIWRRVTH